MGQRAALLLSELLLLLAASRTLLAVSFPEDSVPLDVVDAHCEYAHMTRVKPKVYFGRKRAVASIASATNIAIIKAN